MTFVRSKIILRYILLICILFLIWKGVFRDETVKEYLKLVNDTKNLMVSQHDVEHIIRNKALKNVIFVYSAYRVNDTTIRIVTAYHVGRKSPVYFFYKNSWKIIKFICNLDGCNMGYSPKCIMKGHIGIIDFLTPEDDISHIYLSNRPQDDPGIKVPVKDVRLKSPVFHHTLGVCVQSLFSSADWVSYVQFFELWINQGATKFYIYRQSNSVEVEKIFSLYKDSTEIQLEIIEWSRFPMIEDKNQTINPNLHSLRMLGLLSVFDCMHRARGDVQFLAETDIDEVIFAQNGTKLRTYMEKKFKKNPNMASVLFQSRRIRAKNNWYEATHPNQLTFDFLKHTEEENFYHKQHWTKMVHLPHRTVLFHHHFGRQTEKDPDGKPYKHLRAPPKEAMVLHFRKFDGPQKWKGSINSTLLAGIVPELNKAYNDRVYSARFQNLDMDENWQNVTDEANRMGEKCALKPNYLHTCVSADPCVLQTLAMNSTTWVVAKNTWLVL